MKPFKTTDYFRAARARPGREAIKDEWIVRVIESPEMEETQDDGRIRR
jgi:hypothetical protein